MGLVEEVMENVEQRKNMDRPTTESQASFSIAYFINVGYNSGKNHPAA